MSLPKKQKFAESEIDEISFKESDKMLAIESNLSTKLDNLQFTSPIEYIYNPLEYAKELHETFIKKYFEKSTKKILFLGLNPGPWGMCQNGIPFGEKDYVKEWFKITGSVNKPNKEHPKKKVIGIDCHRSEISGKKFWGFFKTLCGTPENFFKHSFVYNLCPLAFIDILGKNITPPEIKNKITKKLLNDICDEAFINIMEEFNFEVVISIGKFAEKRAINAIKLYKLTNVKVCSIPHPSPRNAKYLTNWEHTTFNILQDHNLLEYFKTDQTLTNIFFVTNINDSR